MNRRQLLATLTALPVWGAGCLGPADPSSNGGAGQSGSGAGVDDAKLQLEGYQNHENALDDGYRHTGTCVEGLGTLFVRDDVSQVSYDRPNVLLYERTGTDQYELMGAEWFVSASDLEEPPTLFTGDDRQAFRGPMEGHYPEQPTHYGLHVWLFAENPNGMFAKFHTNLACSG